MTTLRSSYFNGTGIQWLNGEENFVELILETDKLIKNELRDGRTLKEMGDTYFEIIKNMEQEIWDKCPRDKDITIRDIIRAFGDDWEGKTINWAICVLILIKLKRIRNDDNNGFLVQENVVLGGAYKLKTLLNTCVVCAKKGAFRKCSGCKKDYYCGAECQKSDWRRHKIENH